MNYLALEPLHRVWQQAPVFTREQRLAERAWDEAKARAIDAFAQERGWNVARSSFSIEQLVAGRPGRTRADYASGFGTRTFDHPNWFRARTRPYRPAAIVVHVYAKNYDDCYAAAAERGLIFEPLEGSWHYPGGCLAGLYRRRA